MRGLAPKSFAKDALSFHAGAHGSFFTVPLRAPLTDSTCVTYAKEEGVSYWRVGIWRLASEDRPPHDLGLEDIKAEMALRKAIDVPLELIEVLSASRYRVRLAVADTLYTRLGEGHILLAGDSCHVHSPAGGQGSSALPYPFSVCDTP